MNDFGVTNTHVAAVYNIASAYNMDKWLKQFEENGVDDLEPIKKGRPSMKKETKKIPVEGFIRGFTG